MPLKLSSQQKQLIKKIIPSFDMQLEGKEDDWQKEELKKALAVVDLLLAPPIRAELEQQIKRGKIDLDRIKFLMQYELGRQYLTAAQKAGGAQKLEEQEYERTLTP